jgi:uncharacterized protein (DUF302 family)
MKKACLAAVLVLFPAVPVMAAEGVIDVKSAFDVEETANRLEGLLNEKGMTIFERIKHSDGAANVGIELRATELFIFGNPKVGSPLMQCQQSVAIDLPQKALIWAAAWNLGLRRGHFQNRKSPVRDYSGSGNQLKLYDEGLQLTRQTFVFLSCGPAPLTYLPVSARR